MITIEKICMHCIHGIRLMYFVSWRADIRSICIMEDGFMHSRP